MVQYIQWFFLTEDFTVLGYSSLGQWAYLDGIHDDVGFGCFTP